MATKINFNLLLAQADKNTNKAQKVLFLIMIYIIDNFIQLFNLHYIMFKFFKVVGRKKTTQPKT